MASDRMRFLQRGFRPSFVVLLATRVLLEAFGNDEPAAVVLLGPTGAGKSQTANTLLGTETFNVSAGLESETRHPQAALTLHEGREWQIVDTPGYLDTSLTPAELDDLLAEFAGVVSNHIIGLVFVVPFGRFGDAHMRAWRLARGAFGGAARKYTALAFTACGDKSNTDVQAEIARICASATPPAVCSVVDELDDPKNVLAFGKLEPERRAVDRTRLFELVDSFEKAAGGRAYNHADFLRTRARRKLLGRRVQAITSVEDRRLLELLLANVESGASSDEELRLALERAEGLGETRRVLVDFEDRTLGPFYQVGTGWRQPMPVPYDSMRGYDSISGRGGRFFAHTGTDSGVRLRHGDRRSGELRSPPFFLGSGEISWEATGAGGFIALCPADPAPADGLRVDDAGVEARARPAAPGCLERQVRRESIQLVRGELGEDELLPLRGSAVYLRIVDDQTSGWGFIALDNFVYPSLVPGDANSTANVTVGPSATKASPKILQDEAPVEAASAEAGVSSPPVQAGTAAADGTGALSEADR